MAYLSVAQVGAPANILRIYEHLTAEEHSTGHAWYRTAHWEAAALAERHGYPLLSVAGVIAALSPSVRQFALNGRGGSTRAMTRDEIARMLAGAEITAEARAAADRLTLVPGGPCYSSAEALDRLDPRAIADDNVIWTFHSYTPFLLTHQGATWAGDFIPYVTGLPYPPDAVPRAELDAAVAAIRDKIEAEAPWPRRAGLLAYLDEQIAEVESRKKLDALMDTPFEKVAAWARRNGVAAQDITLGEFGMIRQEYGNPHVVPPRYRAAYVRDMIARAEARGFSWSVWSYGGAFGVVEAFGGDRAEPDVLEAIRELPPARR